MQRTINQLKDELRKSDELMRKAAIRVEELDVAKAQNETLAEQRNRLARKKAVSRAQHYIFAHNGRTPAVRSSQ